MEGVKHGDIISCGVCRRLALCAFSSKDTYPRIRLGVLSVKAAMTQPDEASHDVFVDFWSKR